MIVVANAVDTILLQLLVVSPVEPSKTEPVVLVLRVLREQETIKDLEREQCRWAYTEIGGLFDVLIDSDEIEASAAAIAA